MRGPVMRALVIVMWLGGVAAADDVCAPVSATDKKALEIDVKAFIDHAHPTEKPHADEYTPGLGWVFTVGCREATGAVYVDVSQDRVGKTERHRRNYVLSVARDHQVTVIEESTSTITDDWMEWADEGRLAVIAQLDLDGDGKRDLIFSHHEHEGGSMDGYDSLVALLGTGKRVPLVTVTNLASQTVGDHELVIGAHDRDSDRTVFTCVMKDFTIARCPAAVKPQQRADRNWKSDATPARQHVIAFLESKNLDDVGNRLFVHTHPEVATYLDQIASQLGDTRCKPAPLADDTKAKLTAWAMKQGADGSTLTIAEECGSYAWVQYLRRGDPDVYEFLMSTSGAEPTKVQKFKSDVNLDGPMPRTHSYIGSFFTHGATIVGWVLRGENLYVIANGKTVATSHGHYEAYLFDRRWYQEPSFDLFSETGNGFWHATPTGLERIDAELVRDHEAKRAAIQTLLDDDPSHDAKYLAALKLLGADAKLIAEAKKL
ncbi:MAG: hypothetical protein QM831_26785 [Kofleriaceae bacterium]